MVVTAVLSSAPTVAAGSLAADPVLPSPTITPALLATAGDQATLDAMAHDLKLTREQVVERRARIDAANAIDRTLRTQLGERYAGAWLDDAATQLTVGVTEAALMRRVRAAGAKPALVSRSEATLDAVMKRLDATLTGIEKVDSWYPSPRSNTVVVETNDAASARAWIRASGVPADAVTIAPSTGAPQLTASVPGGSAGANDCAVGFGAEFFGARGYFTAGHCSADGSRVTTEQGESGTVRFSVFPGQDYAFVQLDNPAAAVPFVLLRGAPLAIRAASVANRFDIVCRSGPITNTKCGSVLDVNVSTPVRNDAGAVVGTVNGMTKTSACARYGDSGGPFYTEEGIAFGVLSAAVTFSCTDNNQNGTSFYQPLSGIPGNVLVVSPPAALRIESVNCGLEQTGPGAVCYARWSGGVDLATASWQVPFQRPDPYVITNSAARVTEAHFACDFNEPEPSYYAEVTVRDAIGTEVSWSTPICTW
jgi:streptogrisin C